MINSAARAIIEGHHHDPFDYLGWHHEGDARVVRVFLPNASEVKVVDDAGHVSALPRLHDAGLFAGPVEARDSHYRLRARFGDDEVELEDAYRFPPILSDLDLHLLGEGNHLELYNKLGYREDAAETCGYLRRFHPGTPRTDEVCPLAQ